MEDLAMAETKKDPTLPPLPNYWWFGHESIVELVRRLATASPDARLRVTPYLKDGAWALMLTVTPSSVEGGVTTLSHEPGVNDSHACPPACGD